MKPVIKSASVITSLFLLMACGSTENGNATQQENLATATVTSETHGQSGVQDNTSAANIVQVAVGSKDHTTLVTAVQTASLVDALSNAGPFTVFAPTNDAFGKLPAGTVEGLLKPEKIDALTDILQYHVFVGVLKPENFSDGQVFEMVNGGNIKIVMKDGKPTINGSASIIASIPTSNGIIHVIDEVLLPK